MNLRDLITGQLAAIKARLAALPPARDPFDTLTPSVQDAELGSERRNLEATKRDLKSRLVRSGGRQQASAEAHRDRIYAERVQQRQQNYRTAAERFEKQGDHRNARLYREAALRAPETIATEMGVTP